MTKDIPLSLQVFHSRNEYEAERLNRTEQIRLKGLHDVLKREEKLYVKNYALIKQKFNSKFKPRQDPYSISRGLSISRPVSVSSRISVFSAPGKLQTNRASSVDSSFASKMCRSFSEISTMNRFQRVQRKFSLASFTENGMLTKRGTKMSENIEKAREILFKQNNKSSIVFPTINERNVKLSPSAILQNNASNTETLPEKGDLGNDIRELALESDNDQSIQNNDGGQDGSLRSKQEKDVVSEAFEIRDNNIDNKSKGQRKLLNLGSIVEESPHSPSVHSSHKDRVYFTEAPKETTTNLISGQINGKKKVTIRSDSAGNDLDIYETVDEIDYDGGAINKDNNNIGEWRSILSKSSKGVVNPLQQNINDFLAAQKDFNRIFPKRFDGVTKTSALQRELASIGKEKREQETRDRKKKNEMVLEVLEKLGIDDEHILCHYKD